MKVLEDDDGRTPWLMVRWSDTANWIYHVLNDDRIKEHLPQEVRDEGWKLVADYDKATGLL